MLSETKKEKKLNSASISTPVNCTRESILNAILKDLSLLKKCTNKRKSWRTEHAEEKEPKNSTSRNNLPIKSSATTKSHVKKTKMTSKSSLSAEDKFKTMLMKKAIKNEL